MGRAAAVSATPTKRRPLVECLADSADGLSPEELYRLCGFAAGQIEDFYQELRAAVESGLILETRPSESIVILQSVPS
jgi:hypothetical protein